MILILQELSSMATDLLTEAKALRFEPSDVSTRGFLYFLLATGLLLVITCLAMAGLFAYYKKMHLPEAVVTPLFQDLRPLAPPPRIQVAPANDIVDYRDAQARLLGSYGWIDQKKGIARIPIDRAMELLLRQGLPTENQNGPGGMASTGAAAIRSRAKPKHPERRSLSAKRQ
jgi:hypothetical protein